MNYKIIELLNLHDSELSIQIALDKYFNLLEHFIKRFRIDLETKKSKNETYIYPLNDLNIAQNFRLLAITGLLFCYEITNNDILTINCKQFINNEKLVTPDVLFYVIVMLNDILMKSQQTNWSNIFLMLIEEIDKINQLSDTTFEINLQSLKELNTESKEKIDDKFNL
ncbi:hypothetical protein IKD56_01790 [bacterium]|nr:hypothetical protein [bacterium]